MTWEWSIAKRDPDLARALAGRLKWPAWLGACLVNRGIRSFDEVPGYLDPRLRDLGDPFLVPGMEEAVDLLFARRGRPEPVLIFGDYDVDGVTSTAVLVNVLSVLGWKVHCYLPHRLEEGYGLSMEALKRALEECPARLLVAVDCGSSAVSAVDWLRAEGRDVIVVDHHPISVPPPRANALINPHRSTGVEVPWRHLCAVGLAFKLAHGLVKRGRELGLRSALEYDIRNLLDLVALGTVADLVPLAGENRILASAGLRRLEATARPGLCSLKRVAGVNGKVGAYEVGFQLGPRLNAAGRLETARNALELLLSADEASAEPIARELDAQNRLRQEIEKRLADQVVEALRGRFNPATDYAIVEGQSLWHIGVVGIVAARVLREFHRPTIIVGGEGEEWRGSGRSIEGFDLAAALKECDDLLVRYGGHAMAAGLTIKPARLEEFRSRLNRLAREALTPDLLRPRLKLDAEAPLHELTPETLEAIGKLEPFGQGNPPVQLVFRGLRQARPPRFVGKENRHVKMWVTDGRVVHEAIWWGGGGAAVPDGPFDLAAVPQWNEFNGSRSIQLRVLGLRER